MNDEHKNFGGVLTVEVVRDGPSGPVVIDKSKHHNLTVTTGKIEIARMLLGLQLSIFNQGRIGTDGTAPAVGDTNVLAPIAGTLVPITDLAMEAGQTGRWIWSYPSGGGSLSAVGIQEAVILNSPTSPGGDAMMRVTFTPKSKTTADKLLLTYRWRIA